MNMHSAMLFRQLASLSLILLLSGCAGVGNRADRLASEEGFSTSISSVAHYGKGIGIPVLYVNGTWGGNQGGWGGGGGTVCCATMANPAPGKPVMVTVKWQTRRGNLNEERWHEEIVPVHFSVPPGKSSGMYIHFLPGHKVEAWITRQYPWGSEYPGPAYPRGPAPDYVPLPDELPSIPLKEK